jgi:hypothetical protein
MHQHAARIRRVPNIPVWALHDYRLAILHLHIPGEVSAQCPPAVAPQHAATQQDSNPDEKPETPWRECKTWCGSDEECDRKADPSGQKNNGH